MPRFHFRLTTLLRLRERDRDDCRAALAEAFRVDDALSGGAGRPVQQQLDELQALCRRTAGPGPVDVEQLLESRRYQMTLRGELASLQQQRQAVAAEIERRRQALVEANREVRVLEKLRDRQAERFRDEENRRQIKLLDEIAQNRPLTGQPLPALTQEAD